MNIHTREQEINTCTIFIRRLLTAEATATIPRLARLQLGVLARQTVAVISSALSFCSWQLFPSQAPLPVNCQHGPMTHFTAHLGGSVSLGNPLS